MRVPYSIVTPNPRPIRGPDRWEQVRESLGHFPYSQNRTAKKWDDFVRAPCLIHEYTVVKDTIHVHLSLWRQLGKGPDIDTCMRFEWDPKCRISTEPVLLRKLSWRHLDGDWTLPYDMKVTMLIDDVKHVDFVEHLPETGEIVVPSVIRLQPLDSCPFSFTQTPDSGGGVEIDGISLGGKSFVLDREHGVMDGVRRNDAFVVPDVQLEHEIVEGSPEIVETIADNGRPARIKWLNLADAEAVRESIVRSLNCYRAEHTVQTPIQFPFQEVVVLCRPHELGNYWLQTPVLSHSARHAPAGYAANYDGA